MMYLYNEDIRRIRKIVKKADNYNTTSLQSKVIAMFIHKIRLLLDKGIYVDKNGDRLEEK